MGKQGGTPGCVRSAPHLSTQLTCAPGQCHPLGEDAARHTPLCGITSPCLPPQFQPHGYAVSHGLCMASGGAQGQAKACISEIHGLFPKRTRLCSRSPGPSCLIPVLALATLSKHLVAGECQVVGPPGPQPHPRLPVRLCPPCHLDRDSAVREHRPEMESCQPRPASSREQSHQR